MKLYFKYIIIILICIYQNNRLIAQDGTVLEDSIAEKNYSLIAIPLVFFSPETNWAFGGGGVYTFRFKNESLDTRPSQIQAGFAYTLNKQILSYLPFQLFLKNEKYKLYGELGYYRYSYFFFGIGADQLDNTGELYGVNFPRLRLNALQQVKKDLFVGLRYWMDDFDISFAEDGGILESNEITGKNGGTVSGLGLVANYDTRDALFYPTKGVLVETVLLRNDNFLGSDFEFSKIIIDIAKYISWNEKYILALNLYNENTLGEAPFNHLALMGGNKKMRGYYEGRFRDNHYLLTQAEFRFPIYKRFGAVLFGAYGMISEDWKNLEKENFKYTLGAGLRFVLSKKDHINIRVDVGYGEGGESPQFYVTVGEAF